MSLFKEFKEFAFKGNVVDMAVGVMIGGAFGNIVTSVVNNLFMPLLSLVTGRIDFTSLKIVLGEVGIEAFDEFVEQWNAQGGEKITEEVQAWVDARS